MDRPAARVVIPAKSKLRLLERVATRALGNIDKVSTTGRRPLAPAAAIATFPLTVESETHQLIPEIVLARRCFTLTSVLPVPKEAPVRVTYSDPVVGTLSGRVPASRSTVLWEKARDSVDSAACNGADVINTAAPAQRGTMYVREGALHEIAVAPPHRTPLTTVAPTAILRVPVPMQLPNKDR